MHAHTQGTDTGTDRANLLYSTRYSTRPGGEHAILLLSNDE